MTQHEANRGKTSLPLDFEESRRVLAGLLAEEDSHLLVPNDETPADYPPIQGYDLIALLGEGGGGRVFAAVPRGREGRFAIKVLRKRIGDGAESRRVWREIDLLQQIRHPAFPRVIDHGEVKGHIYIVSEFVDGVALDRYCEMNELDLRARAELLARVCDAVQALHERGVIHRDIKPSNILVTEHGDPVIIDLGIATLLASDVMETLTADGAPIGTPAFMSPEQARGERQNISTRSDVYSLGATAYLVLTGHTPHDVNTTLGEAIRRVSFEEARDPRGVGMEEGKSSRTEARRDKGVDALKTAAERRSDGGTAQETERRRNEVRLVRLGSTAIDKSLAAVLMKACAREAGKRYASASELADDLRRWVRGEHVEAKGLNAWQKGVRWVGRHPIVSTAAACIGVIAIASALAQFANWQMYQRPWSVMVSDDEREVVLVSLLGKPVWRAASKSSAPVETPEIHERPKRFGGGRVLLVEIDAEGNGSGQLCMFDLAHLGDPVWIAPAAPPSLLPPDGVASVHSNFGVAQYHVNDFFADLPGEEILVLHNQTHSPNCARIYDFGGKVLWECWHRGALGVSHWLPDPALLLMTGLDNRFAIPPPADQVSGVHYPRVVMAVTPRFGAQLGRVNPMDMTESQELRWYKYIEVNGRCGQLDVSFGSQFDVGDSGDLFILRIRFRSIPGKITPLGDLVDLRCDTSANIVEIRSNDWVESQRSELLTYTYRLTDEPSGGVRRPE